MRPQQSNSGTLFPTMLFLCILILCATHYLDKNDLGKVSNKKSGHNVFNVITSRVLRGYDETEIESREQNSSNNNPFLPGKKGLMDAPFNERNNNRNKDNFPSPKKKINGPFYQHNEKKLFHRLNASTHGRNGRFELYDRGDHHPCVADGYDVRDPSYGSTGKNRFSAVKRRDRSNYLFTSNSSMDSTSMGSCSSLFTGNSTFTDSSMDSLTDRSMDSLTDRSMYSITDNSTDSLTDSSMESLFDHSMESLFPKRRDVHGDYPTPFVRIRHGGSRRGQIPAFSGRTRPFRNRKVHRYLPAIFKVPILQFINTFACCLLLSIPILLLLVF
ncbi:Plasmodium exported protein, unknown function [Plasmodium knowlesi strain H]|uniref:Uncharacterized protein n=3 Tax=Plasmodium knowlesi TaxID=5850 RepID=A0A5K1VB55_PLAKH|nr:uncharacterized protein PKNH_1124900 [Plasmodium knowlesi strain H]OTN64398.1 Uncharacterized protein PKNOH_S130191400 [Plasmodium knowlesi]CAA9989077.1 Plasmodium exported protein, unknown function [Plasmodium knowlesi strain H]SBO27290.1 Plasmodium exported protein, unknown function [Plasmodium knowlesi strain H]SBO28917.1 Plasmodium exported protein, unknown function [Plasmodium knowlesi strain H]VVS78551.1 Plasmodium exported protein, unknown function [Plasmodium knowlesi strain H]|eukprot:XP_002261425.1 [Plasmodium knowlesi strain H]